MSSFTFTILISLVQSVFDPNVQYYMYNVQCQYYDYKSQYPHPGKCELPINNQYTVCNSVPHPLTSGLDREREDSWLRLAPQYPVYL